LSAQILFLNELGIADLISVVVDMESFSCKVFQRYRAVIKGQSDGFIFIRRCKVEGVKRQSIFIVEAVNNIATVAAVVNENICARVAPK